MAVIDVFTYNGEFAILKLHLNILSKYVDKFIIIEAKTTFSGHEKPLYFSLHEKKLRSFWPKIEYHTIDENYTPQEIALAESSPNTVGARHWKNEFLQKESIKKFLKNLNDTDQIYIGDVDEIWEPFPKQALEPRKLKMKVYAYKLNNRSTEQFWGTLVAPWGAIKNECLNHLRSNTEIRTQKEYGWHFTSMGGIEEVRRKLNDSYTPESYNTHEVQKLLPERLKKGQDYLGRNFKFFKDETEWPEFLKKNRALYHDFLL